MYNFLGFSWITTVEHVLHIDLVCFYARYPFFIKVPLMAGGARPGGQAPLSIANPLSQVCVISDKCVL